MYRNDASEPKDFCEQEGGIGHEDEESALEQRVLSNMGELRQQGGDAAHQAAHKKAGTEYAKEIEDCLHFLKFDYIFR